MKQSKTIYTHKVKGGNYSVLDVCEYQHGNIWYPAVYYISLDTRKKYVREEQDFNDKFAVKNENEVK
jgi:hypothetical protein